MHPQNDGKPTADQKVNINVHKGEKHEAAATDDDTSNGADRAADKDNEGRGEERSVSRDEEKE
jgi:hypothetical protein